MTDLQAGDLVEYRRARFWLQPTTPGEAPLLADEHGANIGKHVRPHPGELVLIARPTDPDPGHRFPRFGDGGAGSELFGGPNDGRWIGWKPGCGRWVGLVRYPGPHQHPALPTRYFVAEWPLALLLAHGAVELEYFRMEHET